MRDKHSAGCPTVENKGPPRNTAVCDFYVYQVLFATAFHHVIEIMSYEKKSYKNHRSMKFES